MAQKNYEWIGSNPIQKIEKTVKIKIKLPHVKKITSEKANFCSSTTVFSHYFKVRVKKLHATKLLAFRTIPVLAWPKSQFQFDFKDHENVWADLKKRQRHNTIQILWIVKILWTVKNQEHRNIAPLSLQLRSYNDRNSLSSYWPWQSHYRWSEVTLRRSWSHTLSREPERGSGWYSPSVLHPKNNFPQKIIEWF